MKPKLKMKHSFCQLFVVFCLTVVFSNLSFAQRYSESQLKTMRTELINNSEYILQGNLLGHCSYFVDENKHIQSIDIYSIYRVLRGPQELKNKKVLIVKAAPHIIYQNNGFYRDRHYDFPPLYMTGGVQNGIIFCKKNMFTSFPAIASDPALSDAFANIPDSILIHNLILQYVDSNGICITSPGIPKGNNKYYGLYKKYFKDMDAVYDYLSNYQNITIPPHGKLKRTILPPLPHRTDSVNSSGFINTADSTIENSLNRSERKASYEKWIKNQIGNITLSKLKASTGNVDATIMLKNQHVVVEGGIYYFEFDVYTKLSSPNLTSVYPMEILFSFVYKSDVFGPNLYTNNKITCTLNNDFFAGSDYKVEPHDGVDASQVSIGLSNVAKIPDGTYNRKAFPIGQEIKLYTTRIVFDKSQINNPVKIHEKWSNLDMNISMWSSNSSGSEADNLFENMSLEINNSYVLGALKIESVDASVTTIKKNSRLILNREFKRVSF